MRKNFREREHLLTSLWQFSENLLASISRFLWNVVKFLWCFGMSLLTIFTQTLLIFSISSLSITNGSFFTFCFLGKLLSIIYSRKKSGTELETIAIQLTPFATSKSLPFSPRQNNEKENYVIQQSWVKRCKTSYVSPFSRTFT